MIVPGEVIWGACAVCGVQTMLVYAPWAGWICDRCIKEDCRPAPVCSACGRCGACGSEDLGFCDAGHAWCGNCGACPSEPACGRCGRLGVLRRHQDPSGRPCVRPG